MTTRPIHKLVLVVPVEEQAIAGEQGEEGAPKTEQPAPLAVGGPGPAQQEEARATEPAPLAIGELRTPRQEEIEVAEAEGGLPGEVPQGATPKSAERGQKGPKVAVKCKKVISRKKAGEQTRTIIVSVPKEEEEMVDVAVRPKKRGRPRKTPGTDPPDPRKGSVPDPGKGVCADPVNGGAILGKRGPDPQGGNKERQLSPDKERDKT
jgi:hypothetical protein